MCGTDLDVLPDEDVLFMRRSTGEIRTQRATRLCTGHRCYLWMCTRCVPWMKYLWKTALERHLRAATGELHAMCVPEAAWPKVRSQIAGFRKNTGNPGHYARVVLFYNGVEQAVIVTTVALPGARSVTTEQAIHLVQMVIDDLTFDMGRPISASRGWGGMGGLATPRYEGPLKAQPPVEDDVRPVRDSLNFGQYAHLPLAAVADHYLWWMLAEVRLTHRFRTEIETELAKRGEQPASVG